MRKEQISTHVPLVTPVVHKHRTTTEGGLRQYLCALYILMLGGAEFQCAGSERRGKNIIHAFQWGVRDLCAHDWSNWHQNLNDDSLMYALVPRHDTFYMSRDINFQLGGQWDPLPWFRDPRASPQHPKVSKKYHAAVLDHIIRYYHVNFGVNWTNS